MHFGQAEIGIPRAKLLLNRNKFVFSHDVKSECVTCPEDNLQPWRDQRVSASRSSLSPAPLQLPHLFMDGASNLGAVVSRPCGCAHWFAFKCRALEVALPEFMATIYKQLWFRAKCLSIQIDAASSGVLSMRSLLGSFIDFLVWHLSRPPIVHDNLSHLICIWNALGTSKFPIANHNGMRGTEGHQRSVSLHVQPNGPP